MINPQMTLADFLSTVVTDMADRDCWFMPQAIQNRKKTCKNT